MPKRSVSPRFVDFVSIPGSLPLMLIILPIAGRLVPTGKLQGPVVGAISMICWLSTRSVLRRVLRLAGVVVRGRSVERLGGGEHGGPMTIASSKPKAEPAVRVERSGIPFIGLGVLLLLYGLILLMVALIIAPGHSSGSWFGAALFFMMGLMLTTTGGYLIWRPPILLCEIDDRGIRARNGPLGRLNFVPWTRVAGGEIIHDDRQWPDHFLVEDGSGRALFESSKSWMQSVSRADQERIFAALRSRLPRTDRPAIGPAPALAGAGVAASGVWDRELDG